jgi:predicted transglutaminase-like cysteine proteinase
MPILNLIILLLFSSSAFAFNGQSIPESIMKKAERKYGGFVVSRYLAYNTMLRDAEPLSERSKLKLVNDFFNVLPFLSDIENWKQDDYWATPLEFLARNKGDSEDYVIAKYFALKTLGVDPKRLYFTYVNSKRFKRPHMVLSYFESPQSDPLVLDNISADIDTASSRSDLSPVYNFSADTIENSSAKQSTHKKWEELNQRVKRNKL